MKLKKIEKLIERQRGDTAAAELFVRSIIPGLDKARHAFPVGSIKFATLLLALRLLMPEFYQPTPIPPFIEKMAKKARRSKRGSR